MTNQQSAELSKPCIGSLDDPTALVVAQFSAILVSPLLVVLPVGHYQLDAPLLEPLAQRVGVVAGRL